MMKSAEYLNKGEDMHSSGTTDEALHLQLEMVTLLITNISG